MQFIKTIVKAIAPKYYEYSQVDQTLHPLPFHLGLHLFPDNVIDNILKDK